MLTVERNHRGLAQAVAAQDQILNGDRRRCTQIVEKITSLNAYAQAVDRRINEVESQVLTTTTSVPLEAKVPSRLTEAVT